MMKQKCEIKKFIVDHNIAHIDDEKSSNGCFYKKNLLISTNKCVKSAINFL